MKMHRHCQGDHPDIRASWRRREFLQVGMFGTLGLTLPGMTIVCGDSHTSTHGAMGALAFGIGTSEVEHVLATQTLIQKPAKNMRVSIEGTLPLGVTAKDVVLAIIARLGTAGGTGYVIEYAGRVIREMSMEGRMTVCNMSIEAGARAGLVAPDDTTYSFLHGRQFAPKGKDWDAALAYWKTLPTDDGAQFDREVTLDAAAIAPMITWGTLPEDALPITARVPDPATAKNAEEKKHLLRALEYMKLQPGQALTDVTVDRVFIGSCTNARYDDLAIAAALAKGRRAVVPAIVSPGSTEVKKRAEAQGLDKIFTAAGFEWRDSACSMCVGSNGDFAVPGERCVSTSPRNFENRQGRGVRTHLASPAMAVAAAVTGKLTDVRTLA